MKLHRRKLLKRLGATAGLAPLLPLRVAEGQTSAPRRLAILWLPHGPVSRQSALWGASGTETDFTLNYMLEPLEPFKDKMVVISGMRAALGSDADDHRAPNDSIFSGYASGMSFRGGPSFDYAVANEIQGSAPFHSLQLGTHLTRDGWGLTASGPNANVPAETDPYAAFNRLFANLQTGDDGSAAELERLLARKRSILDFVKSDLASVSARLPSEDRYKLDAHLESIRAIESRLSRPFSAFTETSSSFASGWSVAIASRSGS